MKTAHTPGPWTIRGSFIERPPADDEYTGEMIASIVESAAENGAVVAEANARLIAAAPDMLETLYRIRNFFACSGSAIANSHAANVVEDAIAKAEGR